MDVELRHGLWEFVREINEHGTTILLTTHYLEEAEQMCDRIAIMNHGDLIAMEATHELVRRLSNRQIRFWLEKPLPEMPTGLDAYSPRLKGDGKELLLNLPAGRVPAICSARCVGSGLKSAISRLIRAGWKRSLSVDRSQWRCPW